MVIKGTELKLNVHVDPIENLHMGEYDFEIEVYTNRNNKKIFKKTDCIFNTIDDYIICIDTTNFREGELILKFIAYIPDDDFEDELRTEINVIKTGIKLKNY